MIINLDKTERNSLITELEEVTIPEIRMLIASGILKTLRDELQEDEVVPKNVFEKMKMAAWPVGTG